MKNVRGLPKSEYEVARREATRHDPTPANAEPPAPSAVSAMTEDQYVTAKRDITRPARKEN